MRTRIIIILLFAACNASAQVITHWTFLDVPDDPAYTMSFCVTYHNGWYFIGTNVGVFRTQDPTKKGAWQPCTTGVGQPYVFEFTIDGETILARTSAGMRISTDLGLTWTTPSWSRESGYSYAFTVIDSTWYIGGSNMYCQRSTDKGATWKRIADTLGDFYFTRRGIWHMRGYDGLWRSTDEGATWSMVHTLWVFHGYCRLWFTSATDIFVSNVRLQNPIVYYSSNNGATFDGITSLPQGLEHMFEIRGALYWTNWSLTIHRSTDRGATWHSIDDVLIARPTSMQEINGYIWVNSFGNQMQWMKMEKWLHLTDVDDESVSGERAAVSSEGVIRGSVPWTRVHVERDTDVDVYNVLGERVGVHHLSAGEHTLHTPEPCLLRPTR